MPAHSSREYMRKYMREYRKLHNPSRVTQMRKRIAELELEVAELHRCLDVAIMGNPLCSPQLRASNFRVTSNL